MTKSTQFDLANQYTMTDSPSHNIDNETSRLNWCVFNLYYHDYDSMFGK